MSSRAHLKVSAADEQVYFVALSLLNSGQDLVDSIEAAMATTLYCDLQPSMTKDTINYISLSCAQKLTFIPTLDDIDDPLPTQITFVTRDIVDDPLPSQLCFKPCFCSQLLFSLCDIYTCNALCMQRTRTPGSCMFIKLTIYL